MNSATRCLGKLRGAFLDRLDNVQLVLEHRPEALRLAQKCTKYVVLTTLFTTIPLPSVTMRVRFHTFEADRRTSR